MSLLETAKKIIDEFDARQDIPLTTRIMAHGNEALGVLREMLEEEQHKDDVANHRDTWLAHALHYPECWDTAAYLTEAVDEVMNAFRCQEEHPETALENPVKPLILKGVGKINGDGWKDTTKKGEVVLVWNQEMPEPYKEGQYPRIGYECWSASTDQYDFSVATPQDIEAVLFPAPTPQLVIKELQRVMRRAVEADILFSVSLVSHTKAMGHLHMVPDFRPRRHDLEYDYEGSPLWDSQYNRATIEAIKEGLSDG